MTKSIIADLNPVCKILPFTVIYMEHIYIYIKVYFVANLITHCPDFPRGKITKTEKLKAEKVYSMPCVI